NRHVNVSSQRGLHASLKNILSGLPLDDVERRRTHLARSPLAHPSECSANCSRSRKFKHRAQPVVLLNSRAQGNPDSQKLVDDHFVVWCFSDQVLSPVQASRCVTSCGILPRCGQSPVDCAPRPSPWSPTKTR